MQDSLYFHSERDDVSPFYGDIAILPSSVAVLPPGPAETFFMAGVDTIVISGFDAEFRTRSYGSSLQEMIHLNDTMIVAQTYMQCNRRCSFDGGWIHYSSSRRTSSGHGNNHSLRSLLNARIICRQVVIHFYHLRVKIML